MNKNQIILKLLEENFRLADVAEGRMLHIERLTGMLVEAEQSIESLREELSDNLDGERLNAAIDEAFEDEV